MTTLPLPFSGINLAPKLMKGPLFYSKNITFGEYGIIRDSKGLSIPYNFITVH
jgi:mevalonate kinase